MAPLGITQKNQPALEQFNMTVEIYNASGDSYHVGIRTHLACEDYQFKSHIELLAFLTELFTPCTTSNTSLAQ